MSADVLYAELIKQGVALAFTAGSKAGEYLWGRVTRRRHNDPAALEQAVARLIAEHPDSVHQLKALVDADLATTGKVPQIVPRSPLFVDRVTVWQQLNARTGTAVLTGPSGIGKTAAAEHFALHSKPSYPDGSVLVNCAEFRDGPGGPLGRNRIKAYLLARLGVEVLSTADDDLAVQYLEVLQPLRLLVVFDNVESAAELDGLIPPSPMSLVLALTSAPETDFLLDFALVPLGRLEDGADRQLLEAICSPELVRNDPEGTQKLLAQCDRVPAALVVAANRVRSFAALTQRPLAAAATELESGGSLGPVSHAYDEALSGLPAEAAELCRLLTVFPGPSFTAEAAAALVARPVKQVWTLLTELHDQVLVTRTADGRLQLGNQARQAVRRTGNTNGTGEAFTRLVRFYAARAVQADFRKSGPDRLRLYDPTLPSGTENPEFDGGPVDWLVAELPTYRALAGTALDAGLHHELLQICGALEIVGLHRGRHRDLEAILDRGLRTDPPPAVRARMTSMSGRILSLIGEFDRAAHAFAQAEAAVRQVRIPELEASVLEFRGLFHREQGQLMRAVACYRGALAITRSLSVEGKPHRGRGLHARMLANVLVSLRQFPEALALVQEAENHTLPGNDRDRAQVWLVRAKVFAETGRAAEALALLPEAWRLANGAGSNQYDLEFSEATGDAAWRAGGFDLARQHWSGAWQRYEASRHPRRERLYHKLWYGLPA
ncbi:hypothetical protein VSH64_37950 [Amycolatopsis rhabdoformis]|uniref:Tetratricopeptide repeat protein n=1 Tax=Amycolatopsis rhabdoformis TaxID=1448059 RepID=A0ABZ1I323_9PSEU|nr:hypothetical protein [Amycolatopsis rhabdoformis]WSE28569.1 hypothetical protein VSH64_37950 [Amycolatopsis rhabdoformis]